MFHATLTRQSWTFNTPNQGCGVGVDTGVGVGRSRLFWPESESELESVKFGRLRLQPGVATDDDFVDCDVDC